MMNCTLYIYTNTYVCIKGIVRPKMEILSPVWIYFFCWTKRNIFWRMSNCWRAPLTSIIWRGKKPWMDINGVH